VSLRRSLAAATAFAGVVAAAGCGLGAGESVGEVELTVTRDYGSEVLLTPRGREVTESETVLRLLDRSTEISTRYGGGFVQSIDGVEGGIDGGRSFDWFFYVNGVESSIGSADYDLRDGDRVWWDYRDWTAAMRVPAVVGAFPEPFRHGYEGERHPVLVRCMGGGPACAVVRGRLHTAGVNEGKTGGADPIRVLVGPWSRLRSDAAAALIERGPAYSGVFADFVRSGRAWRLQALDATGSPAGPPLDAGLVAATREGEDAPTWVVTGSAREAALGAASLLSAHDLRHRYAVASIAGRPRAVPVP
jgi:Domain of unknown function (DUF4430)